MTKSYAFNKMSKIRILPTFFNLCRYKINIIFYSLKNVNRYNKKKVTYYKIHYHI